MKVFLAEACFSIYYFFLISAVQSVAAVFKLRFAAAIGEHLKLRLNHLYDLTYALYYVL
jgi:hypothetical protein